MNVFYTIKFRKQHTHTLIYSYKFLEIMKVFIHFSIYEFISRSTDNFSVIVSDEGNNVFVELWNSAVDLDGVMEAH